MRSGSEDQQNPTLMMQNHDDVEGMEKPCHGANRVTRFNDHPTPGRPSKSSEPRGDCPQQLHNRSTIVD
jgi:hypothetical protein